MSSPTSKIKVFTDIKFQQKQEITFHPQKQRYKPTYTLIPLASSGFL